MTRNKLLLGLVLATMGLALSGESTLSAEQSMPGKCDELSETVEGTTSTIHFFGPAGIWYTCGTNSCHTAEDPTYCHLHDHKAMN